MRSVLLLLLAAWATASDAVATAGATAGATTVEDFALLDHQGRYHQLTALADVPVVVLYSFATGCPIARQDVATLTRLAHSTAGTARILLLDPVVSDDRAAVAKEATDLGTTLPVLLDPAQLIARDLGITRTGEALVITTRDWKIVWRGPVDDRLDYGTQKPSATRNFLDEAITAAAAGTPAPTGTPAAKGCRITYETPPVADYATRIAPLLTTHCTGCHTTGGVAPFALGGYAQVRSHSAMISEVLRTRRMPPWGADAPSGTFHGDNVLTPAETAVLATWIAAGAPRGEGPDPLTTQPPAPGEWPLGTPDLVIDCPPQTIPATGVLPYRHAQVDIHLPQDTWIRAYDLHPSERAVMHHAFAFALPPGFRPKPNDPRFNGLDDFLADYVPGLGAVSFPPDCGKPLPKGSRIAFQLHYTTNGIAVTDRPRLGLYLTTTKPAREVRVASAKNLNFTIPPGAREHPASGSVTAPVAVSLIGMSPHLHLRGARMEYVAKLPDGSIRQLLSVPHYDLNWQAMYRPITPIALPAGTVITCSGAWDNSRFNPANPDPTKTVTWGEQSWDEMFLGYLVYSVP
jgi:mono/diheme cytochrome c family protein